jgi:hypothetical protein
MTHHTRVARCLAVVCLLFVAPSARADEPTIATDRSVTDATQFLSREIEAHVADVKSLDPAQPTVLGVPTGGDFTWGSFMRAITDCTALTGQQTIGGHNVPEFLGKIGLIEARQGGKTFSQLGAALALRRFGSDLKNNRLWQSLTPTEQEQWRALLDPGRFYDRKTRHVINLPENYMGVAARIATMDYQMGLVSDRAFADDVLERAAAQFTAGALYTDDDLPNGRYDRYSQEYARFVYEAAGNIGRKDIQDAVAPALKAVLKTWWDLVQPDGCGYPWGRTIGAMSYMDTMEIIGFLSAHPEFRPAPLPDLASVYYAAWNWLQHDYQPDRHLLNIFGFGRGNYAYMTPARQWQQTTGFLFKSASSLALLKEALAKENVASFPAMPHLPDVARFEWFRKGDRPAGVWLVRNDRLHFALPITTGVKSGIADYLAAPHALNGFAAPVEQLVPAMVPYFELSDGRTIVASDCADQIEPSDDGRSVRLKWNRWVMVGADPAKFISDTNLSTEVTWSLDGEDTVHRVEKITASQPVSIKRMWVIFPSTADRASTRSDAGQRIDRFESPRDALEIKVSSATVPFATSMQASGNSAVGKGARGPIPLILQMDVRDVKVTKEKPLEWTLEIRSVPPSRPSSLTPTSLPATTATH